MSSPTRSFQSNGNVYSFQITTGIPDALTPDNGNTGFLGTPINLNPTLMKIEGYNASTVAIWMQFWDLTVDPANSLPCTLANGCRREVYLGAVNPNGFLWQYFDKPLKFENLVNGLRVVLSTTQGTYTAPTGTNKSTFYVELEDWEQEPFGILTVGDTTTVNLANIQIWADAAGPKRLVKLEITIGAVASYLQLFATDSPTTGVSIPILQFPFGPFTNKTFVLNFGKDGIVPYSEDAKGVTHNGCTIACSTTSGLYTQSGVMACRASYLPYSHAE